MASKKLKLLLSTSWWLIPLILIVIASFWGALFPPEPAFKKLIGSDFDLSIMVDNKDGEKVSIREIIDERPSDRYLVSLWATWCAPCIRELPRLSSSQESLERNGISLIILNYDSGVPEKIFAETSAWLIANEVNLETFYDFQSKVSDEVEASALPFSFILDRSGVIKWVHLGELDESSIAEIIESKKANEI